MAVKRRSDSGSFVFVAVPHHGLACRTSRRASDKEAAPPPRSSRAVANAMSDCRSAADQQNWARDGAENQALRVQPWNTRRSPLLKGDGGGVARQREAQQCSATVQVKEAEDRRH
jgi:hypothetical protein